MPLESAGRRLGRLCVTGVLASLVSCGPIHKTVYTYTPPHTTQGKICANQCEQIRQGCRTNCRLTQQICLSEAKQQAQIDFDAYVEKRKKLKRPVKKELGNFYYPICGSDSCEDDCDSDHRACFTNCGGRIDASTVCIAFCGQ